MSAPDTLDAVTAFLMADAGVAALAARRIWPGETPPAEAKDMPRQAVVVAWAGSYGQTSDVPLQQPRVDVTCYGATLQEARTLYLAVLAAFRGLARAVYADCLLHSAIQGGGPLMGRHPDTDWPYVWSSFSIIASEEAA